MNSKLKKIYCCTPVAFHANDGFWIRDTGLISSSLSQMGIESKCIMPLPFYDDDTRLNYLIRTDAKNLASVDWWRGLGIDGCVLYSWGHPKYTMIARAIRKAGIRLHIHMDFAGQLTYHGKKSLSKSIKDLLLNFFRSIHLRYANVITTHPIGINSFRDHFMYGTSISEKTFVFPCPVATHFKIMSDVKREKRVACIGRWSDDECDKVKRPEFMILTAKAITELDPEVVVDIYGPYGNKVSSIYQHLSKDAQDRIILHGYIANQQIPHIYNRSKVAMCTSERESTHIASAEALCCGCSLVIPPRSTLRVLHWYTSQDSGSISELDTPESVAQTVVHELAQWEKGTRRPLNISRYWQNVFHVDKALARLFS